MIVASDIEPAGAGQAVESVTRVVVDPDAYAEGDLNRPPWSTDRSDVDIAHSVVEGPGAPHPPETTAARAFEHSPDAAAGAKYTSSEDLSDQEPPRRGPGRPRKNPDA